MISAPVQQIPPGLLSMLGVRNGGQNPSQLGELLSPVLDLFTHYAAARMETLAAVGAAPISANGTFLTGAGLNVPGNEWWYLIAGSARVDCAAATTMTFAAHWAIQRGLGSANAYETVALRNTGGGAEPIVVPYQSGIFLPPGAFPRVAVGGFSGAASNFRVDCLIARLSV